MISSESPTAWPRVLVPAMLLLGVACGQAPGQDSGSNGEDSPLQVSSLDYAGFVRVTSLQATRENAPPDAWITIVSVAPSEGEDAGVETAFLVLPLPGEQSASATAGDGALHVERAPSGSQPIISLTVELDGTPAWAFTTGEPQLGAGEPRRDRRPVQRMDQVNTRDHVTHEYLVRSFRR